MDTGTPECSLASALIVASKSDGSWNFGWNESPVINLTCAGAHVKEVGCDEEFRGIVASCKDEVANSLVLKLMAQLVNEGNCPIL